MPNMYYLRSTVSCILLTVYYLPRHYYLPMCATGQDFQSEVAVTVHVRRSPE